MFKNFKKLRKIKTKYKLNRLTVFFFYSDVFHALIHIGDIDLSSFLLHCQRSIQINIFVKSTVYMNAKITVAYNCNTLEK